MSRKEKRALFFVTLVLFTIFGFGVKWVISEFGWISGTSVHTSVVSSTSPGQTNVSKQDLQDAQGIAHQFISLYFGSDKSRLKAFSTENLFTLFREEMENPLKKNEAKLDKVEKVECNATAGGILCYTKVRVSSVQEGSAKGMIEQVYELKLLLEGTRWLIDEVNVRGSFE